MKIKYTLLKALLHVIGLFNKEKYKYSQEYEDNFKYMDTGEKVWWAYKSVIKQIELAEKGKGIEQYFANQDLNFEPEKDFIIKNKVTISAGGDLSSSEMITPENTTHLWDDVKDFYFSSDIVCGNLEAPVVASRPTSGVPGMCLTAPKLNMSKEMFERFIASGKGVNFFSTANNHSLDQGEQGVIDTLNFLNEKGYKHVGTSRSLEEQDAIPIIEKNGVKFAFISYTYCLNGVDPIPGKEYLVNELRLNKPDTDISLIERHVKIARSKGADIIIAMLHWSIEFETYPIENVIKMGHRIMECGVDIIFGGHAHVAQPMEKYVFYDPIQERHKEGFIIYSLGELVSLNLFSRNSRLASLVKLDICEGIKNGTRIVKITDLKLLPIYIYFKNNNKTNEYKILNLTKTLKALAKGDNPHGFNEKEINELKRLEELAYAKLLPRNFSNILA